MPRAYNTSLTPAELTLRARKAAHARWAKYSSHEHAKKMRAALEERFLDEVDPDRELPDDERYRRAEQARKAYFADLAYKSARARSLRARARDGR
jgi:hypothetical protein